MSLSFKPEKGLIVVPVEIWGPNGNTFIRLALDTGATRTTINWAIIVWLGYDPAAVKSRTAISTASGVEFVPQIQIERIEALGQSRRKLSVLCHTLPPSTSVDGLLGLDFFQNQKLIIDFQNGTVEVVSKIKKNARGK